MQHTLSSSWVLRRNVPRPVDDDIRVVLARLTARQRGLVERSLERANTPACASSTTPMFAFTSVEGKGMPILQEAAHADVVVLGLEDDVLPGEASHIIANYPRVKVIGVDHDAHARVVLGTVTEPLSSDLPTVIWWITQRLGDGFAQDPDSTTW